jgi:hypothetical protein
VVREARQGLFEDTCAVAPGPIGGHDLLEARIGIDEDRSEHGSDVVPFLLGQ